MCRVRTPTGRQWPLGAFRPPGSGVFSGASVSPAPGFSAIFRAVFSPSGGGVLFGRCTFTVRPYESVPDFRPWCLAGLAVDGLKLKVPQKLQDPRDDLARSNPSFVFKACKSKTSSSLFIFDLQAFLLVPALSSLAFRHEWRRGSFWCVLAGFGRFIRR